MKKFYYIILLLLNTQITQGDTPREEETRPSVPSHPQKEFKETQDLVPTQKLPLKEDTKETPPTKEATAEKPSIFTSFTNAVKKAGSVGAHIIVPILRWGFEVSASEETKEEWLPKLDKLENLCDYLEDPSKAKRPSSSPTKKTPEAPAPQTPLSPPSQDGAPKAMESAPPSPQMQAQPQPQPTMYTEVLQPWQNPEWVKEVNKVKLVPDELIPQATAATAAPSRT